MVTALLKRGIADGDLDVLADLAGVREQVDSSIADLVTVLRGYPRGASWREVGDALGVTPQAAQSKYRKAGGIRRPGGQEARYR
jgi:hypothetical protein